MSKVKADMSGVSAKIAKIKTDQGLGKELADTAMRGMDKFVPYRSGALSDSVQAAPFKVSYNTPYARRMFYGEGFKFTKSQHLDATARWDLAYEQAGGREQLAKAGTDYLKGH